MTVPGEGSDSLWSIDAPWVHVVGADVDVANLLTHEPEGRVAVMLDARRMTDFDGLMAECQGAFRFPEYFGRNWPAFDECVRDLSWLPGRAYHVVIEHGNELLRDDLGELPTFLRTMERAGQAWSRSFARGPEWGGGEVPFNTVIVGSPHE
jgi:hypothetical protein